MSTHPGALQLGSSGRRGDAQGTKGDWQGGETPRRRVDLPAKEGDVFLNEFKRQSLRKTGNEVLPSLDGIP